MIYPQCKHTTVNHMQPVLFREAQEAFNFTDTYEDIAKRAIETYNHNLIDMYTSLQEARARKEQNNGPKTQQEAHAEGGG